MSDELDILRQAVREELADLWFDLTSAQTQAHKGKWSIQCEYLERRIKALTPLVGPTPWEKIQFLSLGNGVYERIHADLGIAVTIDWERVAALRAHIQRGVER